MLLRNYGLFFFDCETGGLDPREADMVEVAAILTDPTGCDVLDEVSAKVFPRKPVHPRAAAVNGYSVEKWASEAVELGGPLSKMVWMSRNAIFTAHNTPFDWAFFDAALRERGLRWQSDYHRYDTAALAMPLLRHGLVPNLKLETLTSYFGIEHDAHRALGDVRACRQLYLRLMDIFDPAVKDYAPAAPPTAPAA